MTTRHVIVDGSNLATEGRNMPSLEQLDRAVREFIAENPRDEVTVVVDASFGHRIDPSEVAAFEAAEAAGEVISPPAGAIGRGDAFLLRIAEKIGATVLSNDSFQEFHAEHSWLFEKGRLIGGKPVPGIGWIFMDRTPVRGAKSREVIKEAKRRKRVTEETAPKAPAGEKPVKARPKAVDRAIARATQEVVEPGDGSKGRRRRVASPPSEPVNEPLAFITFIAAHPLGSQVVGTVVEYSSHGAFVDADGARCYIPLSAMGDPAPRKAREVVNKGEEAGFVVQAFDPQRRGIELALPGFAHPAGSPTAETVEAEIHQGEEAARGGARRAPGRRRAAKEAEPAPVEMGEEETPSAAVAGAEAAPEAAPSVRRRRVAKAAAAVPAPVAAAGTEAQGAPAAAEAAAPAKRRPSRRAAAVEAEPAAHPVEAAPAKKAVRKRAAAAASAAGGEVAAPAGETRLEPSPAGQPPVGKVPPRRAAAKRPPAVAAAPEQAAPEKAAPSKAAPSKAAAKTAVKKAPARKAAAAEAAPQTAIAEKAGAKKAPAKKAAAGKAPAVEAGPEQALARKAVKKAPAARKAPTAEAPTAEATARKAPARKAAARKAAAEPAATPIGQEPAVARKVSARKAPAKRATTVTPPDSGGGEAGSPAGRKPSGGSRTRRAAAPEA